jgi:hypothetical protein
MLHGMTDDDQAQALRLLQSMARSLRDGSQSEDS